MVMNQVMGAANIAFPEQTLVKRLLLDDAVVEQFNTVREDGNELDSLTFARDARVATHAVQQVGDANIWFVGK